MRFATIALVLATLTACGVEETGYLTGDGVYFTEDVGTEARVLVVRPEAVDALGGTVEATTYEGTALEAKTLEDAGVAWVLGTTDGVELVYTLGEDTWTLDRPWSLAAGPAPVEDPASAFGWVSADVDGLTVTPSALLAGLPLLVVNQTNGASVIVTDDAPATLEGGSGDRVCASELAGTDATASLCTDVP